MDSKMNSKKTKIFSFVLFAFVFAGLVSAQPKAVIHPMEYNYGDIVQDSVVTKIFVITNEGNDVLKITRVWASCGCTAVVAGKNELMPSESTEIKVTFDSKERSGKQNKTVYIETNDPKNPTTKIALTGNVLKKERSSTQIEKSKT
ncbi:MAG TPA: hypothetical protein DCE80_05720 [Ignavibacteriales bacterium]|nr:hypothetical protein [Ignavibacteriales bacterium]